MTAVGYACAVVLAALFVWAAAAKLARPAPTTVGFRAMGVPAPRTLATVVPMVELLLAVALVTEPRVGGAAALVLLALFSAVVARATRAGVTTGCTCFGSPSARPVSASDLARNLLLSLLAVGAMAFGT